MISIGSFGASVESQELFRTCRRSDNSRHIERESKISRTPSNDWEAAYFASIEAAKQGADPDRVREFAKDLAGSASEVAAEGAITGIFEGFFEILGAILEGLGGF